MTQINLLPWREIERERKKREFFVILGVAVALSALLVLPIYALIDHMIENQKERNTLLTKKIKRLDARIAEIRMLKQKKAEMILRMSIIQRLQTDRANVVKLYDELVKIIPSGVHVTKLINKRGVLTMDGISDANTGVSTLMRNIENSSEFADPVLIQVTTRTTKQGNRISEFNLEMKSKLAGVPQSRKEDSF